GGPPTQIAVPGIAQIRARDPVEPTCHIEASRELVGDCLIVDKSVCVCRADGLFVEPLCIELAALDARNLRADQCGTVLEILRAVLRPYFELPVVSRQGFEMLLSLVGSCGIPGCRVGKRTIELKLCRFEL